MRIGNKYIQVDMLLNFEWIFHLENLKEERKEEKEKEEEKRRTNTSSNTGSISRRTRRGFWRKEKCVYCFWELEMNWNE